MGNHVDLDKSWNGLKFFGLGLWKNLFKPLVKANS